MNSFVLVAFLACLAAANAGLVVSPGSAKIIQGPSSRATIVGPDGSSITSSNGGGTIVQEDTPGFVAHSAPAPVIATYAAHSAPLLSAHSAAPLYHTAYSLPLAYHSAPIAAYSAPIAYHSGIVAEKQLDTLIAGPSGTIATSKTVHRPALVAAPQAYARYYF